METTNLNSEMESENNTKVDKPLSPVLSTNKLNRRILLGRKLNRQRSRVKLTTRFEDTNCSHGENSTKFSVSGDEKSSDVNQSDTIEERMNKIKDLEKEGKRYYTFLTNLQPRPCQESQNLFVKNEEFEFKKPVSPVSSYKKSQKNCNRMHTTERKLEELMDRYGNCIEESNVGPIAFQTASGRRINISRTQLEDHLKLFQDIIKVDDSFESELACTMFERPIRSKRSICSKIPRPYKSIQDKNCKVQILNTASNSPRATGFQTASGKHIDVTKSQINAIKEIFSEENLDGINVSPSNKKITVTTACGSNYILTESIIDIAEEMYSKEMQYSDFVDCTRNDTDNMLNKIFANENFNDSSSIANSFDTTLNAKNSIEIEGSKATLMWSNTNSTATVGSIGLNCQDRRDLFSQNACIAGVSDTQILFAADNAVSVMDFAADDWSDNFYGTFQNVCNETNVKVDTHQASTCSDSDQKVIETIVEESDLDVETCQSLKVDEINSVENTLNDELEDESKTVDLVLSQPQVDNYDETVASNEDIDANLSKPNSGTLKMETENVVPATDDQQEDDRTNYVYNNEPRQIKEEVTKENHDRACSPVRFLDFASSKSVINLSLASSILDCETIPSYSKNLIELHRNSNFVGNSAESVDALETDESKPIPIHVEPKYKAHKFHRKPVKPDCEGFTKLEQQAAKENSLQLAKSVREKEINVIEMEKISDVKLKREKKIKDRKTRKHEAFSSSKRNIIGDTIEEEGEENVIEQEEHPNNIQEVKEDKNRNSKKKSDKSKHKKSRAPTSEETESDVPVLKNVKRDINDSTSSQSHERKSKRKDRTKETDRYSERNQSPSKFYELVNDEEIKSTITYDRLSIVSEKSCKKYKREKRHKVLDAKETKDTKEATQELVKHSSPNQNTIELGPNQRKFKIEIDCKNKFHINISCKNQSNENNIPSYKIKPGKDFQVIESGDNNFECKPIQNGSVVKQNNTNEKELKDAAFNNVEHDVTKNSSKTIEKLEKIDENTVSSANKSDLTVDEPANSSTNAEGSDNPEKKQICPDYCSLEINSGGDKLFKKFLNKAHKLYRDIRKSDSSINNVHTVDKPKDSDSIPSKDFSESKDVDGINKCEFKSASGKAVKISANGLKKAQHIYEGTNEAEKVDDTNKRRRMIYKAVLGERSRKIQASGNVSECGDDNKVLKNQPAQKKDNEMDISNSNQSLAMPTSAGFRCASGKLIKLSEQAIKRAEKLYKEIEAYQDDAKVLVNLNKPKTTYLNTVNNAEQEYFSQPSKSENYHVDTTHAERPHFYNETEFCSGDFTTNIKQHEITGFTSASGRKILINENSLNKAQKLYHDCESIVNFAKGDYEEPEKDCSLASANLSHNCEVNAHFQNNSYLENNRQPALVKSASKKAFELLEDVVETVDSALNKIRKNTKPLNKTSSTKRLGISRCKQITIPREKFEKAKLLFENCVDINESFTHINNTKTPTKISNVIYNSTPLKHEQSMIKDLNDSQIFTSDLTPIKKNVNEGLASSTTAVHNDNNSLFVIRNKTEGNVDKWREDVTKQIIDLKKVLVILGERKTGLEIQKDSLQFGDKEHRKQRPGILFNKKQNTTSRISLKNLQQKDVEQIEISEKILEVSPKNAEHVHLNSLCFQDKENSDITLTKDGAMVIPNINNLIGLSEIEAAFRTMAGVEPGLIPKGWVLNHYRFIVWKLASYERFFPQYLRGCLSIENIIQQLKYRYDREIDRAQRPALRKILEKDDVPQKRMVLCVSDIQASGNKIELELSDGWYSIKTITDEPLSRQVLKGNIKIGMKLMIQGAELLNCDGCHPLEATDFVKLKISYNCTRRAAWYVKLGYQKDPRPFSIPLKTVHSEGGLIGCIKVYIARVYPVRYMEQIEDTKIWRNGKAEEKRAREFENDQLNKMERIHHDVQDEYEKELYLESKNLSTEPSKLNKAEICKITCPKTLLSLVESSNDPENFMAMLLPSQRISMLEYRQGVSIQRQQDLAYRISQQVEKLKLMKRKVIPILKLLVIDISDTSGKGHPFCIWNPTEEHLQILKEDSTFLVYNVMPRANGDLFSNKKTYFKMEKKFSTHNKSKRQLFPLAMLLDPYYKPMFNEFDTVGLVVQISINTYDQDLWISDFVGRLLFVKIKDGPKFCSLLDGIVRGHIIALSNLIYCQPQKDFAQAIANQFTVISNYPQFRFLQEGIEMFKIQLPKDLTKLLNDCDKCIEKYRVNIDIRQIFSRFEQSNFHSRTTNCSSVLDEITDDSTILPSRLTKTDIAMSLIDTDQFN